MDNPILVIDTLDDDVPMRPHPLDYALTSAQARRYQKFLENDNNNTKDLSQVS